MLDGLRVDAQLRLQHGHGRSILLVPSECLTKSHLQHGLAQLELSRARLRQGQVVVQVHLQPPESRYTGVRGLVEGRWRADGSAASVSAGSAVMNAVRLHLLIGAWSLP